MALLHQAELVPSKLDLVAGWLPTQEWFDGDPATLEQLGAFRFDDPAGQVGVETLLVRASGGRTLQVPLTYRDAPLPGADAYLVGNMEHSVLGTRWCYDGIGDPVYLATVEAAALTGGHEAELQIEIDGVMTTREPTARVMGSGPIAHAPAGRVDVVRQPSADETEQDAVAVLRGTWAAQSDPVILVRVLPVDAE